MRYVYTALFLSAATRAIILLNFIMFIKAFTDRRGRIATHSFMALFMSIKLLLPHSTVYSAGALKITVNISYCVLFNCLIIELKTLT